MKSFANKLKSVISSAVVFTAACVMAGLGLAVIATLAVFAVLAMGAALISAPFVGAAVAEDEPSLDADVAA